MSRSLMNAALPLFALLTAAADARPEQITFGRAGDGELIERSPYEFLRTYADWLKNTDKERPGGRVHVLRRLYSNELFESCRSRATAVAERITYMSSGLRIKGYLVEPAKASARVPVIIFNHGGVMQWGDVRSYEILEMCRIAARGYVVLASHFRGEGGSEGKPEMGGGDVVDSLNLMLLAERLPRADTTRVGMWGFSRGGGVTYQALANTTRLAAAVIIGGPTDPLSSHRRAEFDEHVYPHVLPDYARDKDGALLRIAPIHWAERMAPTTPMLLLHGGADWRVFTSDSLRMAARLQELERPYRLKIYEGGSHSLLENYEDVRVEMDRWFDLYLRDRALPPQNKAVKPPELQ